MRFKQIAACMATAALILASSCVTPKDITYMQGFDQGDVQRIAVPKPLVIRPDDRLAIIVTSKDMELAQVFNRPVAQLRITKNSGTNIRATSSDEQISTYVVSPTGEIGFPVLGAIKVAGMTRAELTELLEERIKKEGLLQDAMVTVQFANAYVSVLGDVTHPGKVAITRDNLSILEALSEAGDLTITGQRRNVLVVRREGDREHAYRLDLTNTAQLMESPAFYLQQNDVVYVEPNNMKKRQSTNNANTILTPGFWVSIATFLMSLSVFIFKR